MTTATVTSKGQVTIPHPIRKEFGIEQGDKIVFKKEGDQIIINKVKPIDAAYYKLLETMLQEWNEPENDAWNDLQLLS